MLINALFVYFAPCKFLKIIKISSLGVLWGNIAYGENLLPTSVYICQSYFYTQYLSEHLIHTQTASDITLFTIPQERPFTRSLDFSVIGAVVWLITPAMQHYLLNPRHRWVYDELSQAQTAHCPIVPVYAYTEDNTPFHQELFQAELPTVAALSPVFLSLETLAEDVKTLYQHLQSTIIPREQPDVAAPPAFEPPALDILRAEYHLNLAYTYTQNSESAIAEIHHNEAIRLFPDYFRAYNNRCVYYLITHNFEAAIADAKQAIRLEPKSYRIYSNRGIAYAMLGNQEQAILSFSQAINLYPEGGFIYANRGLARYRIHDFTGALRDIHMALELEPNNINTLIQLGFVYLCLGKPTEAERHFQDHLAQGPNNPFAQLGVALACFLANQLPAARDIYQTILDQDARFADLEWLAQNEFCIPLILDLVKNLLTHLSLPKP